MHNVVRFTHPEYAKKVFRGFRVTAPASAKLHSIVDRNNRIIGATRDGVGNEPPDPNFEALYKRYLLLAWSEGREVVPETLTDAEFESVRGLLGLPRRGTTLTRRLCDYVEKDLPHLDWVVRNFATRRLFTVLYGTGGSMKSTFTIRLAVAAADGQEFGPFSVPRPMNVLFIQREDDEPKMQKRFAVSCKEAGVEPPSNVAFLPRLDIEDDVCSPEWRAAVADAAREMAADLIVIDPVIKFAPGLSENDAVSMNRVCDGLVALAELTNTAVVVCAHSAKGADAERGPRGSSALRDGSRGAFACEVVKGRIRLTCTKIDDVKVAPVLLDIVTYELENGETRATLRYHEDGPVKGWEHCDEVLKLIVAGHYSSDRRVKDTTGVTLEPVLTERFGLSKDEGRALLDEMAGAGLIAEAKLQLPRADGRGKRDRKLWIIAPDIPDV